MVIAARRDAQTVPLAGARGARRRVCGRFESLVLAAALLGGCDGAEPEREPAAEVPMDPAGKADDAETCDADCEADARWDAFVDARPVMLAQLAEPALECNAREDTWHPGFSGCYDWHSHVHAVYALHVAYRLTGDLSYLDAADDTLDAEAMQQELEVIVSDGLLHEQPYGYAWFLRLAIEREQTTGRSDLRPLAEELAERLHRWLGERTPRQMRQGMLGNDYDNIPWAVLNLWQWAHFVDDDALAAELRQLTHDTMMDPDFDQACPLALDAQAFDEFFPPCLQRARTIIEVASPQRAKAWIESNVDPELDYAPLRPEQVTAVHHAGLNFSRAWGLWSLWQATGELRFRDAYVEHIQAHLAQPQHWRENYDAYSHWVPQFGIYALDLSAQR